MPIPDNIIDAVADGRCILFLGAMASAMSPAGCAYPYTQAPPNGSELSQILAMQSEYDSADVTNLQRVSLFFEFHPTKGRNALVTAVTDALSKRSPQPSPALHMLAALPFPIFITTNYDRLFDIALNRASTLDGRPKVPRIEVYDPTNRDGASFVPLDNPEDAPVLLKLHGDITRPESIVITEEDYLRFIQRMTIDHLHPIHENIRARMQGWPLLFIGYSLRDYNLRLLLRTLRWGRDPANYPLSFSVDPKPDALVVSVWQRGDRPIVTFLESDLWDFVPELYRRIVGHDYP